MRAERPSIVDLVKAVRGFLDQEARPALGGRLAFHARVAANALGIVERELTMGAEQERSELAGLLELLGGGEDGRSMAELNRELSRRIRAGEIGRSALLMDHLRQTIDAKLAIDNPKYRPVKSVTRDRERSGE